jgi:hypothetical protein
MPDEQVNPGIRGRYVQRPAASTIRRLSGLATITASPRFCLCGNRLNSYNPGPDCNACKKAERDELLGGDE